jgi:hypothetical protein
MGAIPRDDFVEADSMKASEEVQSRNKSLSNSLIVMDDGMMFGLKGRERKILAVH